MSQRTLACDSHGTGFGPPKSESREVSQDVAVDVALPDDKSSTRQMPKMHITTTALTSATHTRAPSHAVKHPVHFITTAEC